MAPLAADLHSWATGGGPTLTVLALIFLFVIIVNLINLCTTCQKQSFELEHVGVERNSSTLVRVVKLEDALAAARENPDIDEIKKDEQELSSVPEEGVPPTQANGEAYTAWRNHSNAATQHSALPEETQVGNGAPVGTSGANGGGGGGGVGGSMGN